MQNEKTHHKNNIPKGNLFVILILILIVIFIILLIFTIRNDSEEYPFMEDTALEYRSKADEIANDWQNDSELAGVNFYSHHEIDGVWGWDYRYYSPSSGIDIDNHTLFECISIPIDVNGDSGYNIVEFNSSYYPISNWVIDNDGAYEIAESNPEIKRFLNHEPDLFLFQLSNNSLNSYWQIEWTYDAGIDNPKWAEIHIDATTGEILFVEVDN